MSVKDEEDEQERATAAAWAAFNWIVDDDAEHHDLTDMDALMAWKLGLAAFLEARGRGARFPHDPPEAAPKEARP